MEESDARRVYTAAAGVVVLGVAPVVRLRRSSVRRSWWAPGSVLVWPAA